MEWDILELLSEKDVKRFETAKAKVARLWQLHDIDWLCAALAPFKKLYLEKLTTGLFTAEPLNKRIGLWPGEVTGPSRDLFAPNICRKGSEGKLEEEAISFGTSASKGETPGVSFLLIGGGHAHFYLGSFFGDTSCEYNDKLRVVYETARYFYPRRALYQKIRQTLEVNQEEFAGTFGKGFVAAISLLFSVTGEEPLLPDFDFYLKKIKTPLFCQTKVLKTLTWGPSSLRPPWSELAFGWTLINPDTNFSLFEGNKLRVSTEVTEAKPYFTSKQEETAFVAIKLNESLKQMEAFANFGIAIYEKIKPRIFVENI